MNLSGADLPFNTHKRRVQRKGLRTFFVWTDALSVGYYGMLGLMGTIVWNPDKFKYEEEGKEKETNMMEMMGEVYPEIKYQVGDLQNAVREIEATVLKDPEERMSLSEFLNVEMPRRKVLILASTIIVSSIILAACNNPSTETPSAIVTQPAMTETLQVTPTAESTATPEVTPTMEMSESQIDKLVFEREIPQMSQEEMAKIVEGSFRLKYNGVMEPLGYVSMSGNDMFFFGVVTDIEKAQNKVDGNDWWRVLMITEAQKSELGGKDGGKYVYMPIYFCGNEGVKYNYEEAKNGFIQFGDMTLTKGEPLADKLNAAKEKYGNFGVFVDVFSKMPLEEIERIKTTPQWEYVKDLIMEISYGSDVIDKYVMDIIRGDYDGITELMQTNPPKFISSRFTIPD